MSHHNIQYYTHDCQPIKLGYTCSPPIGDPASDGKSRMEFKTLCNQVNLCL